MATLQKFKHFAIQCGASQSPTWSPVVPLRRRKTTLRMLLSRRKRECLLEKKKGGDQVRRHSLKDLFLSSPPGDETIENEETRSATNTGLSGSGYGPGSPKPAWTGFRYRSLTVQESLAPYSAHDC